MMSGANHDLLDFVDEPPAAQSKQRDCWRLLIVDDEDDVHAATTYALRDCQILGRPLELLHAFSAAEARQILTREHDVAVVLLDVVLETPGAGLDLVAIIREELGLSELRIVLRTGQPGYAPELRIINDYDINDYRTKGELTATRLITTLTAAIRGYEQLCALNGNRRGLALIARSAYDLFSRTDVESYASTALTLTAALLRVAPDGLVAGFTQPQTALWSIADLTVFGALGPYQEHSGQPLSFLRAPALLTLVEQTLQQQLPRQEQGWYIQPLRCSHGQDSVLCLRLERALVDAERPLLDALAANIALGLDNALLIRRLHQLAYQDALTDLPNRQQLLQRLQEACNLRPDWQLLLIDIERFSEINNVLGQDCGDELLRSVAFRLRRQLSTEVVLARLFADVFALLGPADRLLPEDIQRLLAPPLAIGTIALRVQVLSGRTLLRDASSAHEALNQASVALSQAKIDRTKRHRRYEPELGKQARSRVLLLNELNNDLREGGLRLFFQPRLQLANGSPTAVEALLRWQRHDGQLASPEQFLPLAEQTGLSWEIAEWVLHSACLQAQALRDEYGLPLRMALNLSWEQLRHAELPETLEQLLHQLQLDPALIELELAPNVLSQPQAQLEPPLQRLHALGVQLTVDRFGSSATSMLHLSALPLSRLNIDLQLVERLAPAADRQRTVAAIIELAARHGLGTTAIGIETEQQLALLKQLGCAEGQGRWFTAPLYAADLHSWLAQAHPAG